MTLTMILCLYLAFRAKQFACDFLLQTDWMATTKGMPGVTGYRALFSHAAVHGAATLLITVIFVPQLWWLGPVDMVFHALVDRLKGIITYHKGWKYTDRWFWWSFGMDQEAHNLTHLAYILFILSQTGVLN